MKFLRFIFRPFLGKKIGQKFFELLHLFAVKGRNYGMGSIMPDSGEIFVLKYIKKKIPKPIIFDVGANVGDYTEQVLKIMNAKAYCFEPSPRIYQILQSNLQGKALLYNLGFSDRAYSSKLFYNKAHPVVSSIYEENLSGFSLPVDSTENIQLETLDNFCERNQIKRIDFLKIDVEGHEFAVLQGAKKMLGSIRFIQFEIGRTTIAAHRFFKDFYDLLSKDYYLFRLLKNGLQPISTYKETDEVFVTTNYLAERK